MNWSNKVVLITGASSGIGRALAIELAKRGAAIGLLARRMNLLTQLAKAIHDAGGKAIALHADVTDPTSISTAVSNLQAQFGSIDILIANAGIGGIGTTDASALDAQEVTTVLQINLVGPFNSAAAVIPQMVKNGSGHLVAISSLAAYRALPKSAAYCASKAGISAFFESLRTDLSESNVDVTIIYPGFIRTPLTASQTNMPYLMELDYAIQKMIFAIEKRKKVYAFPWQLASIARICLLLPNWSYDWIVRRLSFTRA